MNPRLEIARDRPDLAERADEIFSAGWPEFIFHEPTVNRYASRVAELFADLNFLLLDGGAGNAGAASEGAGGEGAASDGAGSEAAASGGATSERAGSDGAGRDTIVAGGWGVPVCWNGTVEDLPGGYTGAMVRAVEEHGRQPDTLVVMAAQVREDCQGRGLAADLLGRMCARAERDGLSRVIAPVRPTLKARYPLSPMRRFMHWTRDDGAPLDPWLRTHHRMGAVILAEAERSMTMTGTVAEWEGWTGMRFPDSGPYVVPGALAPVVIDRTADRGEYVEPNVWVRHR
ncbi:hypothetical protein [Rugosimonospora africana]|uniref:hypothetical protein n=1 Tax=Rugosimonospora africana TaxID=556532 RepID=UPI00194352EF|nr:hypothetical protein [Rugosimonospora africana]